MKNILQIILMLVTCFSMTGLAADTANESSQNLDQEVQALKKSVLELNRELFILEEELLFPANTQVSVFLSMDVGTYFKLDSVQLLIDEKELTNYLYTAREIKCEWQPRLYSRRWGRFWRSGPAS